MTKLKQKTKSINMQADDQVTVGTHFFWFPEFGNIEAATLQEANEIIKPKKQ